MESHLKVRRGQYSESTQMAALVLLLQKKMKFAVKNGGKCESLQKLIGLESL